MSNKANERILAREGRAWLMETAMGILTEAEVKHMPPVRIRLWVDRRYEGGWEAFERDNAALIEPDPAPDLTEFSEQLGRMFLRF